MTDEAECVYPAQPHTKAKHKILEGYLKAWMPIIASVRRKRAIRYVDGFAGAGEYSGGEPGSPIIALSIALNHVKPFATPIRLLFIEKREDRYKRLCKLLEPFRAQIDNSSNVTWTNPILGDCEVVLDDLLKRAEAGKEEFGPALIFLDQFGYSQVPVTLIKRIMHWPSCEIFTFMNWRDLNHYLEDSTKWPAITRAFGGEEWKEVITVAQSQKQSKLRELYEAALRNRAGVRYMCRFDMRDRNDKLLYWLFFLTKSTLGLEEMKNAMWRVDTTGDFYFSDRHTNQPKLLKGFDQEWLADALLAQFQGREIPLPTIVEYVLELTPCYIYNQALTNLEKRGVLTLKGTPPKRRRGSFKMYSHDAGVIVCFAVKAPPS